MPQFCDRSCVSQPGTSVAALIQSKRRSVSSEEAIVSPSVSENTSRPFLSGQTRKPHHLPLWKAPSSERARHARNLVTLVLEHGHPLLDRRVPGLTETGDLEHV